LILFILWGLALTTNGVGGGGDSLTHYFISELAWTQPFYFFDQWGKPFFTLFSSPWSQAGFVGIKLFNTLCGVLASLFTCLTARELKKDWFFSIPLIAFIAPAFFTYLFSGLTEPFAALVSIVSVWLCLRGKVNTGFLLAGFLPFCRSEAQVFLVFFFLFGMLNGHWKKLPLLFIGYLAYSILGGFFHDNFLWVFDSPYDSQGSVYGKGVWYHYLARLGVMLGVPGVALAGLGFIQFFRRWFWLKDINWKTEPWLVHGPFTALLCAHSLVWALGIYGSAGLERTLMTAFPFLWIIMLDGLLLLRDLSAMIRKSWSPALPLLILVLQITYVLTNPSSKYYWQTNLFLNPENKFLKEEVGPYIKEHYPDVTTFVMDKPYMAVALDVNFKNPEQRQAWYIYNKAEEVDSASTLWLYDGYYVRTQYSITLEQIRSENKLEEIKSWDGPSDWNFVLFKKRASSAPTP
ncbi:MAG TPA: hypothetical protein DDW81_16530, partial [Cryomorphaceae bacterium]|nr:hypothetical protein [Cryomorphaceae bacterium]